MEKGLKSVTAVHSKAWILKSGLYHLAIMYFNMQNGQNKTLCLEQDWTDNLYCMNCTKCRSLKVTNALHIFGSIYLYCMDCMKCRSLKVTNVLHIFGSINCFEICCGLWLRKRYLIMKKQGHHGIYNCQTLVMQSQERLVRPNYISAARKWTVNCIPCLVLSM